MAKEMRIRFDPTNTDLMAKVFKTWSSRATHLTTEAKINVNTDWVLGKVVLIIPSGALDPGSQSCLKRA